MPKVGKPKLTVYLAMWSKPRYKILTKQGKKPVDSLPAAREYAAKNGYSGISVKCI